jgi:hypothetical protein
MSQGKERASDNVSSEAQSHCGRIASLPWMFSCLAFMVAPCFQRAMAVSLAGHRVEGWGLSRHVCCYATDSAWKHVDD